jgi:hypothetical protein
MLNKNFCVITQCYENYGDEYVPYWKAKWGSDFVVMNCPTAKNAQAHVEKYELYDDNFTREQVLIVKEVEVSYLTEIEQQQLQHDGEITTPSVRIDFAKVQHRQDYISNQYDDVREMNYDYIS